MVKAYKWSKVGTRFLYKVRHHKGHGIHSPFVFNLINKVIEEKQPYYFYEDISNYLTQFDEYMLSVNKSNLLAFRLVNYFDPKTILEIGSSTGVNTLCLTGASLQIKCISVERDASKRCLAEKLYGNYGREGIDLRSDLSQLSKDAVFDCIYINLDNYRPLSTSELKNIVKHHHEKSFVVVKGIRSNRKQKQLWQCLCDIGSRTVMLDLFNIGILFFDKQLTRWEYQISF